MAGLPHGPGFKTITTHPLPPFSYDPEAPADEAQFRIESVLPTFAPYEAAKASAASTPKPHFARTAAKAKV